MFSKRALVIACSLLTVAGCAHKRDVFKEQLKAQSDYAKLLELAEFYGRQKNIPIVRRDPPEVIEVEHEDIYAMSGKPMVIGKKMHGVTMTGQGKILVLNKKDKPVLWHEYGHWFFCNNRSDEDEEAIADDFADFVCISKK